MKNKIFISICLLAFGWMGVSAQLNGFFSWYNDGHLYFTANNATPYAFTVQVVAQSEYNNVTRSEYQNIQPGGGFYLGPTTPWRWYWHSGDVLYVTYSNGQTVYWVCEETESKSYSPSFKGKCCHGTVGCDCKGFVPTTDGDVWELEICKKCKHKKSAHTCK